VNDESHRRVLLIEGDPAERERLGELVGGPGIDVIAIGTPGDAVPALAGASLDCAVVSCSAESGFWRVLGKNSPLCPVIVYGKNAASDHDIAPRRSLPGTVIRWACTPELVLDATTLFLHQPEATLPPAKRKMLRSVYHCDPTLRGKRVLVVDDDVRNVFSIVAVLEPHEIQVTCAENGLQALEKLEQSEFDLVLMDIMMPRMDGYEATRRIRGELGRTDLPVIALTAKAMGGDRDKCIEAGASDYVMKPVDPDQLVSVIRVWLA
jgi:CheY-like chemotaxis protein